MCLVHLRFWAYVGLSKVTMPALMPIMEQSRSAPRKRPAWTMETIPEKRTYHSSCMAPHAHVRRLRYIEHQTGQKGATQGEMVGGSRLCRFADRKIRVAIPKQICYTEFMMENNFAQ